MPHLVFIHQIHIAILWNWAMSLATQAISHQECWLAAIPAELEVFLQLANPTSKLMLDELPGLTVVVECCNVHTLALHNSRQVTTLGDLSQAT